MNWPRKVKPAVSVGLFGLLPTVPRSVISFTGPAASLSFASMMPPALPISSSAARTVGVSEANGGSFPNMRPKRPESKYFDLGGMMSCG